MKVRVLGFYAILRSGEKRLANFTLLMFMVVRSPEKSNRLAETTSHWILPCI
jgi:hypothetical protein